MNENEIVAPAPASGTALKSSVRSEPAEAVAVEPPAPAPKKADPAPKPEAAPAAEDEGDDLGDEPGAKGEDSYKDEARRRKRAIRRLQREKADLAKQLAGYEELRAKVARQEHESVWNSLHTEEIEEGVTLSKAVPLDSVWKLLDYAPEGEPSKEKIIQTLLDRRGEFPFLFAAGGSEGVEEAPQGAINITRTAPAPGVNRGTLVRRPDGVEAQVDAEFKRTGRKRFNQL